MSKVQLLLIVLVALVSVVYGGGDAFIPIDVVMPDRPPIDVVTPIRPPIEVVLPSIAPIDVVMPSLPPIDVVMPSLPSIDVVLPSLKPIDVVLPSLPSIDVVLPSLPSIDVVLPSVKPEEPHTGTGPSFDDVSSSNGSPPDCYYPWLDLLKLFNPMNQNGNCNLQCKSPKWKKQWKVGAFLFFGGRDVCCCNQ